DHRHAAREEQRRRVETDRAQPGDALRRRADEERHARPCEQRASEAPRPRQQDRLGPLRADGPRPPPPPPAPPPPGAAPPPPPDPASSAPPTPPAPASRIASAICERTSPARPAPSARCTARSRRRPSARTSSRLATLAHAISSTIPTVPSRIQSGPSRSPTSS